MESLIGVISTWCTKFQFSLQNLNDLEVHCFKQYLQLFIAINNVIAFKNIYLKKIISRFENHSSGVLNEQN